MPDVSTQEYRPKVLVFSTTTVKQEPPKYVYRGDKFRDPFIPLTDSGYSAFISETVPTPSIGSLTLKGIIDDKNAKTAVITGGGNTFILRDGKLFDTKNRLIKGISGAIRKDSVLLTGPDRTSKEIFLRIRE